ncbi:DUF4358 domain-containing protein [Flavonifractor hominis]|uniref:DUF4358 domain-containing protein n=1 Tax=Flavonifractor hominis TaxID=3133178 RepID=A0ABV1EQP7_9FIRM
MKKRIFALTLAGALVFGLLAGCGKTEPAPETTPPAVESPAESPELPEDSALPQESPEAIPETTQPVEEETPESTASTAPSAKPSTAPTTQPTAKPTQAPAKPTQTPAATPTPAPESDPVQETWDEIAQLDLPSLTDLDDSTLNALYGIDPADLDSYICKIPVISVQATEFFIAKVKDGKMDTVKACVEKRQADLEAQWSQYLPEQLELVQNYKLVTNGNYILFVISDHADEAVNAFNSYTK